VLALACAAGPVMRGERATVIVVSRTAIKGSAVALIVFH